MPGRNIFILAAVCLSVVVIAVVVKEKNERTVLAQEKSALFASTTSKSITGIRDIITKTESDMAFATETNPFAPSETDTLTDTLSKNIFLSYAQYDNQGLLDTSEGPLQIAENVIANIDTTKLPQNVYTYSQVKTFTPKIALDLITYGNLYAEAEIGNLSLIKKNPKVYEGDLAAMGRLYKKVGADLMKIKTPTLIATNHVAIANAYAIMGDSLVNISESQKDPLKATLSVKLFREALTLQTENYLEIAAYIQGSGIIFPTTSPGAIFNAKK